MAAIPRLPVLMRHLPTAGGVGVGLAVAATIALLSIDTLEHLVWTSGIASLVSAAVPPLGRTARVLLAVGGGLVAGAVMWSALFLVFGPGGFLAPKEDEAPPVPFDRPSLKERVARLFPARAPSPRRADAGQRRHQRPPQRRPMSAADLGTPLMEVATVPPVERPLPRELDQPLAAFDPAALPPAPREPQRVLPALAPGERLDTFELSPPPPPSRPMPAPVRREPASQSIDSLLRRLEEGAGRKAARA